VTVTVVMGKREGAAETPITGLRRMVVLIGLMGAGKSAVGRRVAQRLGVPFIDADTEIEKAAGATINEIFAREGEAVFRAGERRVIARLLDGPPGVLAAGGGAFMDPATRARIRERGISLWLKADLETLVQRTSRRATRPLLAQGDPRETLARLMEIREPVYVEADLTVDSVAGPVELTVQGVLQALASLAGPDGMVDRTAA
jgi:shikimate kinase